MSDDEGESLGSQDTFESDSEDERPAVKRVKSRTSSSSRRQPSGESQEDAISVSDSSDSSSDSEDTPTQRLPDSHPAASSSSTAGPKRARNYVFTLNNYTDFHLSWLENKLQRKEITYYVVGKEVASTGTPHLQGFLVLAQQKTFSAIKKWFDCGNPHIEVAMTTAEAIDYCKKDGDFVENGRKPLTPAARAKTGAEATKAKWDLVRKQAEAGDWEAIDSRIYCLHVASLTKVHNMAKLRTNLLDTDEVMMWFYGATGTGKSAFARYVYGRDPSNLYLKGLHKWWDGYERQDYVLIEEIDPVKAQYLGSYMKIWADRYPFQPECKGGSTKIRPKTIIVCSNYKIEECFPNPSDHEPLLRRFDVHHFTDINTPPVRINVADRKDDPTTKFKNWMWLPRGAPTPPLPSAEED